MSPTPVHCFLCGSADHSITESLTRQELLDLWELGHCTFSQSALGKLAELDAIAMYRCAKCGFSFFDPELSGNELFYSEYISQNPGYYAANRPENLRNATYAQRHGFKNILDIGCGFGHALDEAHRAGLETFGIELTPEAGKYTRSRGHHVFETLVEDLDPKWRGSFDMISLNQVIEHVSDPVGLIRQCAPFLAKRGVIAVAVPHEGGILRFNPWLNANWPPHHVSRWRKIDLQNLAEQSGLDVLQIGSSPLLGSDLLLNLLNHRENCLKIGRPYHGLSPVGLQILAWLYRKMGMKYLFHQSGHSIFCYMQQRSQ